MRLAAELSRVFYGWRVAVAVGATAFIAWGVAFYQLGVFMHAFHEQRGWSLAALSVGPTLFYVIVGLTNLVAGRVVDRYDGQPTMYLKVFGGTYPAHDLASLWMTGRGPSARSSTSAATAKTAGG